MFNVTNVSLQSDRTVYVCNKGITIEDHWDVKKNA